MGNSMCLLEFECAKRLKAHSQAIPALGTNFSDIVFKIQTFSLKKINLEMSSGKCRPFCLGLNVLSYLHHLSVEKSQKYNIFYIP